MQSVLKLRRFLDPPAQRKEVNQSCELCGAAIGEGHAHVIDLESRRLMCSCRPCYLLFTNPAAASGKFRSVAERYLRLPMPPEESIEVPVGIAFFLRHGNPERVVAFYPSPAGATESTLSLENWEDAALAVPAISTLEPDIEALLVARRRDRAQCWIVPVDACYELVGRIRRHWRGFEGGPDAWREIDAFFASLAEREEKGAAWAV